MRKSAFTLLELVMVLGIVGILVLALSTALQDRWAVQKYQAEACFNQIDGQLRNFTNATLMGKMVQGKEGGVLVSYSPDYYIINFDTGNNTINFKWKKIDNSSGIYLKANLSTQCTQKSITLEMNGSLFENGITDIVMSRGFREVEPGNLSVFYFSGSNNFTGEIKFNICTSAGQNCKKEFAKWIIDKRVQGIFAEKCLYYTELNPNKCEKRQGSLQL